MIIKIQNNIGGFLFFDNVEEVDYQKKYLTEKKITQVGDKVVPLHNDNNIERQIFIGGHESYTEIYFRQKSRSFRFRSDRPVYILNDAGKTIEKLN